MTTQRTHPPSLEPQHPQQHMLVSMYAFAHLHVSTASVAAAAAADAPVAAAVAVADVVVDDVRLNSLAS